MVWSTHTVEYYIATKRNDTLTCTAVWMKLETITLRERSQTQKATEDRIPFIWNIQTWHSCRDGKWISGCQGAGGALGGLLLGSRECSETR